MAEVDPQIQGVGNKMVVAVTNYVKRALDARSAELSARIKALEDRPQLRYRGVYTASEEYTAGTFVTFAGSVWHANRTTRARPGDGGADWTLAVKAGQPGRDAR